MRDVLHLWLGKAANKTRLNKFLKETYAADDRPISEFAASQGVNFYDHDFMDIEFNKGWKSLADALLVLACSSSYAEGVREKVARFDHNFYIACFNPEDFGNPHDYEAEGLKLDFIGTFKVDLAAKPEGYVEPDFSVYIHVVSDHSFELEGEMTKVVKLDVRGLMIGKVNPYARSLDISSAVPNVDTNQVRISRNAEGLWELRDFGNNGLTKMSSEDFDDATWMPFPGVNFSIGEVTFLWSDSAQLAT